MKPKKSPIKEKQKDLLDKAFRSKYISKTAYLKGKSRINEVINKVKKSKNL